MRDWSTDIEFKASGVKRPEVRWLVGAVLMLLGCAAVLAACVPKRSVTDREPGRDVRSGWVLVKFVAEDEESTGEAYALVNPWELGEKEAWKCAIDTGSMGYQLFAVIQKDETNSSGFAVGLVETKGEEISALAAGAFTMVESDAIALSLAGVVSRTVMIEVVPEERGRKIKEDNLDLVKCEKKENALVPERVK